MKTVKEALDMVSANSDPVREESVALSDAHDRVLAQDVFSKIDLPRFDNAAVDGYALLPQSLRAVGVPLAVLGTVSAGRSSIALAESCAVKVMTGAKVPDGTSAVVMREDVAEQGENIVLGKEVAPGFGVRRQGEEVSRGDRVASKGVRVTPPLASLLASIGLTTVDVYKKPTVTVIVTGDELAIPGEELRESDIFESNGTSLRGALMSIGIEPRITYVADTLEAIRTAIDGATTDVILTTGGVSVGDFDFVRQAVFELGYQELFWRVEMKPGKPLLFAKRKDVGLFFGLPGNPVSALVTFAVFVAPALRALEGGGWSLPPRTAPMAEDVRHSPGRTEYVRARYDGDGRVTVLKNQGSHMMTGMAHAQFLAVLPPDRECLKSGEQVEIVSFPWRTDQ